MFVFKVMFRMLPRQNEVTKKSFKNNEKTTAPLKGKVKT